jgi:hypothetical protein
LGVDDVGQALFAWFQALDGGMIEQAELVDTDMQDFAAPFFVRVDWSIFGSGQVDEDISGLQ